MGIFKKEIDKISKQRELRVEAEGRKKDVELFSNMSLTEREELKIKDLKKWKRMSEAYLDNVIRENGI